MAKKQIGRRDVYTNPDLSHEERKALLAGIRETHPTFDYNNSTHEPPDPRAINPEVLEWEDYTRDELELTLVDISGVGIEGVQASSLSIHEYMSRNFYYIPKGSWPEGTLQQYAYMPPDTRSFSPYVILYDVDGNLMINMNVSIHSVQRTEGQLILRDHVSEEYQI